MGGTNTGAGNVTTTAEFNFWYDPEAVFVVLDRIPESLDTTIITFEATLKTLFSESKMGLKNLGKIPEFFLERSLKLRENKEVENLCVCDLVAAVILLHPELVTEQEIVPCSIELSGDQTRGQMIMARTAFSSAQVRPGFEGKCSIKVPSSIDVAEMHKIDGLDFSKS